MTSPDISTAPRKTGFLFLSGAGLGPGIWQELTALLENPVLIADYPHRREMSHPLHALTFQNYVDDIVKQAEALQTEGIVLVAHSIGGCVGLAVAERLGHRLRGFVAIAAAIPENGGSFPSTLSLPQRLLTGIIIRLLGTKPPENIIVQSLCNDLNPTQIRLVLQTFSPESVALFTEKCRVTAPAVPKLYISLSKDKSYPPALQDKSIRNLKAGQVETLDAGHLPMLSQPVALARLLQHFGSSIS